MSPFHVDELAAQTLARQSSPGTGIRPFMPDQHREFFAGLQYLFVGSADERGWPTAFVLAGDAGFIASLDPSTLRIDALPALDDPAAAGLRSGAEVGLLGLDFTNRRRNRANGPVTDVNSRGFTVGVTQSFGNCAQYIQTRLPARQGTNPQPREILAGLDDDARRLIAEADTFFIASRSRAAIAEGGFDVSHRGGRSGFVAIEGGDTLAVPDFRGNRFFNTFGNLLGDPRAGLLFIDFVGGDLLQLQGSVTIDWEIGPDAPAAAQRVWRCRVERGWRRRNAFPFSWQFGDYAPTTLATGVWRLKV